MDKIACNVCVANEALGSNGFFTNIDGNEIGVVAEGKAEFSPAKFKVGKNGQWSKWIPTGDLAGEMSKLGLDIKDHLRDVSNDKYLETLLNFK